MNARVKRPGKNSKAKAGCGCLGIGVVVLLVIGGIGAMFGAGGDDESASTTPRSVAADADAGVEARLVSVVDGDTIETSEGAVRLIGIDAPESGQCGFEDSKAHLAGLVSEGDRVTLRAPEGENDRDQDGRILRYVATSSGTDLGQAQLEAGNAVVVPHRVV